jgi:hypothetical protein
MRGLAKRATGLSFVIVGIAAVLLLAPASQGAQKPRPKAHAACAPTGCTETSVEDVPGSGLGSTMTDQIPSNADQGSIDVAPTCAAARDRARARSPLMAGPLTGSWAHAACDTGEISAFGDLVAAVVDQYPAVGKLKKVNQRIVTCALLAQFSNQQYDFGESKPVDFEAFTFGSQGAFLTLCLRLAYQVSAQQPAAATDAGAASAACSQVQASIPITVTRTRRGYVGKVSASPHRTTARTPIAVACRRSGVGFRVGIRPRRRGRTLSQVGAKSLGIAYANHTSTPLAIRTTFKVN